MLGKHSVSMVLTLQHSNNALKFLCSVPSFLYHPGYCRAPFTSIVIIGLYITHDDVVANGGKVLSGAGGRAAMTHLLTVPIIEGSYGSCSAQLVSSISAEEWNV